MTEEDLTKEAIEEYNRKSQEEMLDDIAHLKVKHCEVSGWIKAVNAARTTMGLEWLTHEPSELFKQNMFRCEHSPLRMVDYTILVDDVPMWVTVHIVRHHIGIEKFVHTQRPDRTGSLIPRDDHKQGERNTMMIDMNAQALINISKVRMCNTASKVTHALWNLIVDAISKIDPVVGLFCVPNCVYRGVCSEMKSCGFYKTEKFKQMRETYVKLFDRNEKGEFKLIDYATIRS